MEETAIKGALEAGKIILEFYNKKIDIQKKEETYNLVTEVDLKAEKAIVDAIKEKFPDHSFLTEENETKDTGSEYLWVIDPLDGTNNYSHGFPFFCTSVALYKNNEPLIGVVYDPLRDELFYAEKGKGAYLNNKKITVSQNKTLKESILVTGFYYDRGSIMKKTLSQIQKFFESHVVGIRRTGSAALDACYVASGRLDGFWELHMSPWDYAASSLIVKEAGGIVTDTSGKSYNLFQKNILASNGLIHQEMLDVLRK